MNLKSILRRGKATFGVGGLPVLPCLILLVIVVGAIFASLIAPYSPNVGSLPEHLMPPFWQEGGSFSHILGTDRLGRDILSRLIYGSRISLVVALAGAGFSGVVGSLLGLVSGYCGGMVDRVIMRLADMSFALPSILLALLLAVMFGPSFINVLVAVTVVLWARYARLARGQVLSMKERDFVSLARIAGCSPWRIMTVHILPNIANSLIVLFTLNVGFVVIMESSLSFLGAGIPPPAPSWGVMVADGRALIASAWWVSFSPGLAILLLVLSVNLVGDRLRDIMDPTLRSI